MNLEEKLYTSTEVAQILGVSLRSVYRYLEEGKLDAEVKTATGRHRFTKQNILDFLYPKGEVTPATQNSQPVKDTTVNSSNTNMSSAQRTHLDAFRTDNNRYSAPAASSASVVTPVTAPKVVETAKVVEPVEEEEVQVDWLAKFREAAKKFREEETAKATVTDPEPVKPEPFRHEPPRQEAPAYSSRTVVEDIRSTFTSSFVDNDYQPAPKQPEKEFFYYRSMLGGLKDIAQNIDRSARKSSVEYAFTRNSGLSLHKPIRPFSLLHSYIKPMDKEFFERSLHLVPSDENNAQLCLISTTEPEVFLTRRELHNLFVVSDNQLKRDLMDAGEEDLVAELESIM